MATSALLSVLILGIALALKCKFSSAHGPAAADSSSNAVMTLYQLIGDVYDLKYENKIMAEKIEILEEASAEGKMMAKRIEMLEEKLESLETTEGNLYSLVN